VKTDDLEDYAKTEDLDEYAKVEDLEDYAKAEDLNEYLQKTDVFKGGDSTKDIVVGGSELGKMTDGTNIAIGGTVGTSSNTTVDFTSMTAVGKGSSATQSFATAFGVGAEATGAQSTAVGSGAKASHTNSIALGYAAQTAANDEMRLGSGYITKAWLGPASLTLQTGTPSVVGLTFDQQPRLISSLTPVVYKMSAAGPFQFSSINHQFLAPKFDSVLNSNRDSHSVLYTQLNP
jgi:hypothetical protein